MKRNNLNYTLIFPVIFIAILVFLFFLYNIFFKNIDLNITNQKQGNSLLSFSKLQINNKIIQEENIKFNLDVPEDFFKNREEYILELKSSDGVGRKNPFLP